VFYRICTVYGCGGVRQRAARRRSRLPPERGERRDGRKDFQQMTTMPVASGQQRVMPATIPHVSEEACPAEVAHIPTEAGRTTTVVTRRPPGAGPFPAMIHLHGGLNHQPDARLVEEATWWPTHNR